MRFLLAVLVVAACGDNHHRDAIALLVSPTEDLHTSEDGGTAQFGVSLTEPPTGTVHVTVTSVNTAEGVVAPAELELDPSLYAREQIVTVTGVDDPYADGDRVFTVHLAAEGNVLPIEDVDIAITNDDNDIAGVTVAPQQGLMTSEAGLTASFTVRLTAKPMDSVTIPIASARPTEGVTDVDHVTFDGSSWDLPQTVVVRGVDDSVADGAQPYTIVLSPATSMDPAYNGFDPDDVQAINIDDDVQAIVVAPTHGLVTTEAGGSDHFSVVLASQPTADVTIALTVSPTTEDRISTASLTFTATSWATPQIVTVTGVDDLVVDGDRDFTVTLAPAVSADPRYDNLDPDDVTGINRDNDTAAIVATPLGGLVTSERLTNAYFEVTLHSQPTAPVTIPISSSDPTEGTVYPASLQFTAASWNLPQTVTIHGVDDTLVDGDIAYHVDLGPATSTDLVYDGRIGGPVDAINLDNETAEVVIDPPGGMVVSEFGDTETFNVTLAKRPTATVKINLSSSDTTEGFVLPAQLVFTTANWNVAHTVTVTGVDDLLVDGNQPFEIITAPAVSTDPAYNNLDAADVTFTNIDNETPQVYVKTKPLLTTSEAGTKVTYQMRLTTAPTANVVCPITSDDTTEGIANPAGVIFTPGSFGFQTVTITGIDDAIADGDQLYDVIDSACTSSDPVYSTMDPPDVHLVNRDND